jgi:4'-phosphopantetheinyl transferase EntD
LIPHSGAPGPLLGRLFQKLPVVFEEMRLSETVPDPHPLEAEQVATAVVRRRIEFAAGRHCARRALARLSIENFVLRNGQDRAPCWPPGVVGAITHTGQAPGEGYCGVVVARATDVVTVGVDAESTKPLKPALWAHVLTAAERSSLEVLSASAAGLHATAIFSAKECFYKAQFPLSHRFLRFHDVEIALDPGSSMFEARLTEQAPPGLPLARCAGRFVQDQEFVVTGIALPV